MPRERLSSFRRTSGSKRRRVSWSKGPGGIATIVSASGSQLLSVVSQANLDDLTITRLRGSIEVGLVTASAGGEGYTWAVGVANVTENAFGIGITAVPTPLTDINWDGWLYHVQGNLISRDATPLDEANLLVHIEVDSKAMRKTHNTDGVIAVAEFAEVGTATMRLSMVSRILDKLS